MYLVLGSWFRGHDRAELDGTADAGPATRRAACAAPPTCGGCAGGLLLQLALEFAALAAIILAATAAILVLLDWWFRFGLAVRILLLFLSLAAVAAFLALTGRPALAVVAAGRAFAGPDARSLPAGSGPADRRRAPASGPGGRAGGRPPPRRW